MRIANSSTARPEWFDRNAQTTNFIFAQQLGGGDAGTVRWTYTCPVNRKAIVTSATTMAKRQAAAAPAGIASAQVSTTVGGVNAYVSRSETYSNTVDAGFIQSTGWGAYLNPGELSRGISLDSSTGGTVQIVASASITEFDA